MGRPWRPKLVFHDVDGCLNDPSGSGFVAGSQGTLSAEQRAVLERVGRAFDRCGIDLVLNTGRDFRDTHYIAEAMKCRRLSHYLLEHSAYAWDVKRAKEVDLGHLAQEQHERGRAERYRELAAMIDLLRWYDELGQGLLSEALGNVAPSRLGKRANLSLPVPGGLNADGLLMALKACIEENCPEAKLMKLVYCHSEDFVDVLGPVHKFDGAFVLAKHLGLEPEDTLAVGDGMNDIDLFRQWPKLLCPANANADLLELCRARGGRCSDHPYAEATLSELKRWGHELADQTLPS
jgi:hydroxymethylpyrimidine pyrophosphatase-like HAD family hydrolase